MELNKKAAYLQGLVDGLGIDDTTKEGKIIKAMSALLGEMAEVIESVDEDLSRAYDQINDLSDELEDLEADLYEEDEDGESEDAEDEDTDDDDDAKDDDIASEPFYEVACPNCGETVYVSEDDLDAGEANCAHCGVTFEVALEGDGEEDAEDGPVQYEVTCPDCGTTAVFEEDELLGQAAKEAHAYVSIGVSERGEDSATLYNSNLVFSPEGELLNVHRKLKPTGAERLVYGDANKDYFPITDTPWGPMGNLICWESYMPLARVALYQKGITLYISPNTNDNPEWQDTIKHIAIEGHCFFINADMVFTKEMYPKDLHCPQEIEQLSDIPCRGGSCVVDPYGHYVTQPVWDKEEIIYADLDMQQAIASRMEFDGVGHYARPDVLELRVHE